MHSLRGGNGGPNAGHNIYDPDTGLAFDTHQLPSGIFNEYCMNLIGQGCVADPTGLVEEMDKYTIATNGGVLTPERLLLSLRAHIITPGHKILDIIKDEKEKVNTTGRGIGPAYTGKVARIGIRAIDLLNNPREVSELLNFQRKEIKRLGGKSKTKQMDGMLDNFYDASHLIRPFIVEPLPFVRKALASDKKIIAEGAQGVLLGINTGTYRYVTSSDTTAAGIVTGIDGIQAAPIKEVLGIFKLPMSRVGNGPFITELTDSESDIEEKLAGKKGEPGAEFGATTGRKRDIGWFDAFAGRYAVEMGGIRHLALTKLDMLDGIEPKVCTGYKV